MPNLLSTCGIKIEMEIFRRLFLSNLKNLWQSSRCFLILLTIPTVYTGYNILHSSTIIHLLIPMVIAIRKMKPRLLGHLVYSLWISSMFSKIEVKAVQTEEGKSMLDGQIRAPINLQSLSPGEKKKFKDSFDIIFLDCGGVLYDIGGVINNAHEAVRELIKEGKTIRYVTNSNRITKATIIERLKRSGFESATEESVICPMGLIADYIRDNLPSGKSVYVVGPEIVCEELSQYNIHCFGPGKDDMSVEMTEDISKVDLELLDNVGAVIAGFDIHINYLKILKAYRFLMNKECLYIVLTLGKTCTLKSTNKFPAGGAVAAMITVASGREPFVLGKPGPLLIEMLKNIAKDPGRALFVGDQLDTDILTGHICSFKTLFVLTGYDKLEDIKKYVGSRDAEDQMCIPEFYTSSFSDLVLK